MKYFIITILSVFLCITCVNDVHSQCDTIATVCSKNIEGDYISDGQMYRALLNNNEVAEFRATFFGGSTYRIAGCSGFSEGNLVFRIFDQEKNLLFSNSEYENAPHWDFAFKSTLDCTIEANLSSPDKSGCAVLLMGFK